MGNLQELPLRDRVDLRVMAMREYPKLEPQHQTQLSVLPRTPLFLVGGGHTSQQRGTVTVFLVPPIRGCEERENIVGK